MATIIIKNSGTAGNIPSILSQGELAINVKDGRLFYGSGSAGTVKEFTGSGSSGGSGTPGGSNTQIQYNNAGAFGGVPVLTYDGTNLNVTGSFSGSLAGTAATASYLNTLNQNLTLSGSLNVTGSLNVLGPILIGSGLAPALNDTTKVTVNSGITTIYSIPTASYDGAFFDYVIHSGSNARAGQIMSLWSGTTAKFTETTTTDFGDTSAFTFGVNISGSNLILSSSATSNSWTVKAIVRSI